MLALLNRLAALVLAIQAGIHGYRVYQPFEVMANGMVIPQEVSLPAAIILGILAITVFLGARRL